MPNKIFSINSAVPDNDENHSERLVVEIAKSHVACIAKSDTLNTITAFEIFRLKDTDTDFGEVFSYIQSESKLLLKTYTSTKVFVQNEMSVLVPSAFYKKESGDDFLNAIVGETAKTITMNDTLKGGDIVNTYRVPMNTLSILHLNLGRVTVEHTYSQIVQNLLANKNANAQQVIKVQFYYDHIIVAVLSGKALQLIQTFDYKTPADVLYYLLNIVERLQLDAANMVMEVSGMIDMDSNVYNELFNYFKNVSIEEPAKELFHQDAHEFPAHYFTPIFNLAI